MTEKDSTLIAAVAALIIGGLFCYALFSNADRLDKEHKNSLYEIKSLVSGQTYFVEYRDYYYPGGGNIRITIDGTDMTFSDYSFKRINKK
jgi:hypothetical protein